MSKTLLFLFLLNILFTAALLFKKLNFIDFCKVAELMSIKAHLTVEGVNKIRAIKMQMNRGRFNDEIQKTFNSRRFR
jgi:hypothetical protein